MIAVARYFLIAMAVMLLPIYAAWIFGGWIADRRAQCRTTAHMKGKLAAPAK